MTMLMVIQNSHGDREGSGVSSICQVGRPHCSGMGSLLTAKVAAMNAAVFARVGIGVAYTVFTDTLENGPIVVVVETPTTHVMVGRGVKSAGRNADLQRVDVANDFVASETPPVAIFVRLQLLWVLGHQRTPSRVEIKTSTGIKRCK